MEHRKEDARPAAATAERAARRLESTTIENSVCNFSTEAITRQGVFPFLLVGRANAISSTELAQISGLSARQIRGSVERLRRNGIAVCASGDGYYLAESAAELSGYVKRFDHRLSEMRKTRAALGYTLAQAEGQQTVEGWQNGL